MGLSSITGRDMARRMCEARSSDGVPFPTFTSASNFDSRPRLRPLGMDFLGWVVCFTSMIRWMDGMYDLCLLSCSGILPWGALLSCMEEAFLLESFTKLCYIHNGRGTGIWEAEGGTRWRFHYITKMVVLVLGEWGAGSLGHCWHVTQHSSCFVSRDVKGP